MNISMKFFQNSAIIICYVCFSALPPPKKKIFSALIRDLFLGLSSYETVSDRTAILIAFSSKLGEICFVW